MQRQTAATRMREAEAGAREASGTGSHDESVELRRARVGFGEKLVDVLEQAARLADALAEHNPVPDEGARRDVGRGVEGENEHLRDAF